VVMVLYYIIIGYMINNSLKKFTMESLILAQDER
jgi:hypothetical protein